MSGELHNWLLLMDLWEGKSGSVNRPIGCCQGKIGASIPIPQYFPQEQSLFLGLTVTASSYRIYPYDPRGIPVFAKLIFRAESALRE